MEAIEYGKEEQGKPEESIVDHSGFFWLPISNLTYISGMQLHFLRLYLILLQMHHG